MVSRNTLARPRGDIMAPIVTSRSKIDSNNNSAESNNRPSARASTLSRDKPGSSSSGSGIGVKTRGLTSEKKEPAGPERMTKPSSASSSTSSSRAQRAVPNKSFKELPTAARKDVKTPPSSAGAPAHAKEEKAVKLHPLPSAQLTKHKQAAVFTSGKKKHKSNFGSAYDSGSIPCRINHGSIKNALNWTKAPETLDFNPLLVTCVEGFLEVEHPFVFLARAMFRDLMKVDDASEKVLPLLPQIIPPLRTALMSKDDDIFVMALDATRILSDAVEAEMNVYLPKLTQQIHRRLLTKQLRGPVEETLATLERNGGREALTIIRSKIPTYTSVN